MEQNTEKEAEDSLRKTSDDRKGASVSSLQEVLSASDLSSAHGRISRETRSQQGWPYRFWQGGGLRGGTRV